MIEPSLQNRAAILADSLLARHRDGAMTTLASKPPVDTGAAIEQQTAVSVFPAIRRG